MTIKPLQTAKHVGIRWTPDREFRENVIEPMIKPEYRRVLGSKGKVALRSIGISDYDGQHVENAAHFDARIQALWQRRDLLHVPVDDIARKRQQNGLSYRFKFHLAEPFGEQQRRLIDRMQSGPDMVSPPEITNGRVNMLESVFLDFPAGVLDVDSGNEEQLDVHMERARRLLAAQTSKVIGWLTKPEAYVTTYTLNDQDREALALRERQKHPNS